MEGDTLFFMVEGRKGAPALEGWGVARIVWMKMVAWKHVKLKGSCLSHLESVLRVVFMGEFREEHSF